MLVFRLLPNWLQPNELGLFSSEWKYTATETTASSNRNAVKTPITIILVFGEDFSISVLKLLCRHWTLLSDRVPFRQTWLSFELLSSSGKCGDKVTNTIDETIIFIDASWLVTERNYRQTLLWLLHDSSISGNFSSVTSILFFKLLINCILWNSAPTEGCSQIL